MFCSWKNAPSKTLCELTPHKMHHLKGCLRKSFFRTSSFYYNAPNKALSLHFTIEF